MPESSPETQRPDEKIYHPEEKAVLSKIFPQDEADKLFNVGIIAIHGNEPPIMTAATNVAINRILKANGLATVPIVLPTIYEKSAGILLEEFPDQADNIYMSSELGRILKLTEFSRAGYQAHLRSVQANQPKVQDLVLEYLSHEFEATSLSGKSRIFDPKHRKLEINAGANVTASDKRETHFVFPVLLSELMQATESDPILQGKFDKSLLARVKELAEAMEGKYRTTHVPAISTLSAESDYSTSGKLLTPAYKDIRKPLPLVVKGGGKGGVYIMASGNEIGKETVEDQARVLDQWGYEIISPAWLKLNFGQQIMPDVIFNPQVKAVMGRAGWGIMWLSQVANKPFIALPHLWFDNPEIHFNIKALQEFGLGIEFDANGDVVNLVQSKTSSDRIAQLNREIANRLGTGDKDGITIAAENILDAEINARQNQ